MKICMGWSINTSLFELACHCNWDISQNLEVLIIRNCDLCFLLHVKTANLHFISNTALAAFRTSSVKQHPEIWLYLITCNTIKNWVKSWDMLKSTWQYLLAASTVNSVFQDLDVLQNLTCTVHFVNVCALAFNCIYLADNISSEKLRQYTV